MWLSCVQIKSLGTSRTMCWTHCRKQQHSKCTLQNGHIWCKLWIYCECDDRWPTPILGSTWITGYSWFTPRYPQQPPAFSHNFIGILCEYLYSLLVTTSSLPTNSHHYPSLTCCYCSPLITTSLQSTLNVSQSQSQQSCDLATWPLGAWPFPYALQEMPQLKSSTQQYSCVLTWFLATGFSARWRDVRSVYYRKYTKCLISVHGPWIKLSPLFFTTVNYGPLLTDLNLSDKTFDCCQVNNFLVTKTSISPETIFSLFCITCSDKYENNCLWIW